MVQSCDKFHQVTKDIAWFNFTVQGQSTMLTVIRQLEFTLLQLTYQFDNLFDAIHCTIHGKFSIILTDPVILQTILRNVMLQLPEDYQLIVNSKTENIHLFYELAKVSLGANIHSIKLLCVSGAPYGAPDTHTQTEPTNGHKLHNFIANVNQQILA
jgi:hypothetical protein